MQPVHDELHSEAAKDVLNLTMTTPRGFFSKAVILSGSPHLGGEGRGEGCWLLVVGGWGVRQAPNKNYKNSGPIGNAKIKV